MRMRTTTPRPALPQPTSAQTGNNSLFEKPCRTNQRPPAIRAGSNRLFNPSDLFISRLMVQGGRKQATCANTLPGRGDSIVTSAPASSAENPPRLSTRQRTSHASDILATTCACPKRTNDERNRSEGGEGPVAGTSPPKWDPGPSVPRRILFAIPRASIF